MEKASTKRVVISSIVSVLIVFVSLLVAWISKTYLMITSDAVYVAVLLLPILVFAIFSGRLKGLRVGEFEASFETVANQSVRYDYEPIGPSTQEIEVMAKGSIEALNKKLENLNQSLPFVLTLTLGKEYLVGATKDYLKRLSEHRRFKFVVILDKEGNFVAYIPYWFVQQILQLENLGDEFLAAIRNSDANGLRQYRGVMINPPSIKTTNIEALRQMEDQNIEALIVIDEHRRLRGVVERDQIISRLLLGLAK